MKKIYMKPDAEYIVFMSQNALTADDEYKDDENVNVGSSDVGEGGWDDDF